METAVTIKSKYTGELQRFLDSYFGEAQDITPEAMQITYIFYNPIEAHDMVNVFVDNIDSFCAEIWVDFEGVNHQVTPQNLYMVLCTILERVA